MQVLYRSEGRGGSGRRAWTQPQITYPHLSVTLSQAYAIPAQKKRWGHVQIPRWLAIPLCDSQPGTCSYCREEEMGSCTNPQRPAHYLSVTVSQLHVLTAQKRWGHVQIPGWPAHTSLWQSARHIGRCAGACSKPSHSCNCHSCLQAIPFSLRTLPTCFLYFTNFQKNFSTQEAVPAP